ncbi:MAG: hypothetical protein ACYSU0_00975 [Planctomycetota bacterium]|jgi:tetratricopeptide (TPR) repeat protein
MREAAPWVAGALGAVLLLANLLLLVSARSEIRTLRDELRPAAEKKAEPDTRALAPGDLDALRSDLRRGLREQTASLTDAMRSERADAVPAIDPLEAEARAFYDRQLQAFFDGDYEQVHYAMQDAGVHGPGPPEKRKGRYDKTSLAARIKVLCEAASRRRASLRTKEFAARARLLAAEGKLDAAEKAFMGAIVRDYANPLYHREAGDLHVRRAKFREAEAMYRNVIQLRHTEPFGYVLRGKVREKQGKLKEAASDYEAALRVHPANVEARELLDAVRKKIGAGGDR